MELMYASTRDANEKVTASQAILKGLANDGGLYVPTEIPSLDVSMEELSKMTYQETAYEVLKLFLTDYTEEELKNCINAAYDSKFDTEEIAPMVDADGAYYLELFHGPTIAFKDMALSILPHLLITSAKKNNVKNEIVILTATSGDTGKAAMAGFADVPGTRIIVFYPKNGVSAIQEKQMVTQKGKNTSVVGITGNFDDAQSAVKRMFNDQELAAELDRNGFQFSSANSINIGRLVPQIVYYVYAYAKLVKAAADAANTADVGLLFGGLDEISESEGLDRAHMHMPVAQDELINELTTVNKNVIVVLSAGSSVEMPWYPYVKGIVHGYLGGQAGASAMLNVLTGKVCPSGKLNETYPLHYEDTPAYEYYPSKERSSEYREGLYVGYRYYTTVGKKVRFPFGFGLSYTTFTYRDLAVDQDGVTFKFKNTGDVTGTEIAQLYVGKESDSVFRPLRELKGFTRVTLAPGEEKEVRILFDDKTFRFYDTRTDSWEVETGTYQIMIGSNAEEMLLEGSLAVNGTVTEGGYSRESLPEYFNGEVKNISDDTFRRLYGREIPDGSWSGEIRMNDAVCQLYYGKGIFGKIFYGVLRILLKISEWQGKPNLNVLFNYNMPIRGYAKMTGGFVTMKMAEALTEMANGHRIKGTAHLIKAAVKRD